MTITASTEQAGWVEPEWPDQFSVVVDYPSFWPSFAFVFWTADIYKPGPGEEPVDPFYEAAEQTFGLFCGARPEDLPADSPYRGAVAAWRGGEFGRQRPPISVGARVTVVDVAPGGRTRRFVADDVGWTDLDAAGCERPDLCGAVADPHAGHADDGSPVCECGQLLHTCYVRGCRPTGCHNCGADRDKLGWDDLSGWGCNACGATDADET
jgi:hypothetical protein